MPTDKHSLPQPMRQQATILIQAREAIMIRDLNDVIRFWNQGAERLYGWSAEEVLNRSARELFYRRDSAQLNEALWAIHEDGDWKGELHHMPRTVES